MMQLHLDEISSNTRRQGAHAVLLLDRAGWHTTGKPTCPPISRRSSCRRAPRAQPGRERLAVSSSELDLKHRLRKLRRHRRRRMRRLAKADRRSRENHIHRNARMGSRRSVTMTFGINRIVECWQPGPFTDLPWVVARIERGADAARAPRQQARRQRQMGPRRADHQDRGVTACRRRRRRLHPSIAEIYPCRGYQAMPVGAPSRGRSASVPVLSLPRVPYASWRSSLSFRLSQSGITRLSSSKKAAPWCLWRMWHSSWVIT